MRETLRFICQSRNIIKKITIGDIERDMEPGATIAEPSRGGRRSGSGGQPFQRLRARGSSVRIPRNPRIADDGPVWDLPSYY